jgi:hypothetical protein
VITITDPWETLLEALHFLLELRQAAWTAVGHDVGSQTFQIEARPMAMFGPST